MAEGHIYIYGIITDAEDKDTRKFGRVGLKDVVEQMQVNKDAEVLKVHIRSEGGDVAEGYQIYNLLTNSGKIIETIGEGIVASIATVIFLAGSKRSMSPGAEFIIHNPWNSGKGTADDFQKNADELRMIEDKLALFYNEKIGLDINILKDLMDKETILTSSQAKNYGFATEIAETFRAVALFNITNKNNEMTKEEIGNEMDKKFETFFSKIKNLFSKAKNLTVTTGDGVMLDFGDQISDVSEIAVGMTATKEGGIIEGEVVMPDGSTLTFEAGKITAIKPAEGGDEVAVLKAENEDLKKQLAEVQAQALVLKSESETKFKTFEREISEFKAQIKSDIESYSKKENEKEEPSNNRFKDVFNK
ncbi:MAG: head maturation protease, ClpP-related [Candidatus Kapaibacterium sp.]